MQSQPMHRSWEIDALASSELLKSEQPLRSKTRSKPRGLLVISLENYSGNHSFQHLAISPFQNGGGERDRTDDLLLAKQALSQLSYTPDKRLVGLDGFEPSTPALSRRCSNQLSYRP